MLKKEECFPKMKGISLIKYENKTYLKEGEISQEVYVTG